MKRFHDPPRPLFLVLGLLCLGVGCVHKIHVAPVATAVSANPIQQSVRIHVPFLALEGADHMPGITLLDWPVKDLRTAVVGYAGQRGTFTSVSEDHGALTLTIKAWLFMRSRGDYRYIVRFESDLGPSGQPPIKSYLAQRETVGSEVRWVTASDQKPIADAVQAALDDLFLQIEEDTSMYGTKDPTKKDAG